MKNLYKVKFVNWRCWDYVVAESVSDVEKVATGSRDKRGRGTGAVIEECTLIAGLETHLPSLLMKAES